MSKPIVVIIGATGGQGGSVVTSFLEDGAYQVRGITRNVNSAKAVALKARGVELVTADLDNIESLVAAFKDATIIYAVTDFFEPFASKGPNEAIKIESHQGINLAKAAAATSTLKHYIWSTLANVGRISGGKYMIPHFVGKNAIDDFIKNDPALFAKTTFLWNTYYASNLLFPMFKPNFLQTAGKYVWLQPSSPSTPILGLGDQNINVGPFALAIVQKPELTLPGKFVLGSVESLTTGDLLKSWSEVTGKDSEYVQVTLEEFDSLWPKWGLEMGEMLKYWEEFGDKSWSGEELVTKEDLGIEFPFVTIKQAFGTFDWDL
ncbi:NmrA-like family protein-like protein [Cadophora sp. DSE1049]|nr:NmrA-like family protein-like protein [Cadophora sp. DSE1049]